MSERWGDVPALTDGDVWTVADVARYLKCSTKTVGILCRTEGLPCFRLRSRRRFLRPAVLQWAAMRQGKEGR